MKTVSVKIVHGTDIRLVELPFSNKGDKGAISHTDFIKLIYGKYFPLKSPGSLEGHVFKYTDQEGDLVTLGDSSDFDIWLTAVRAHVMSGQTAKPMRLNMVKTKSLEVDRASNPAKPDPKPDPAIFDEKKFEKKLKKLKTLPSKVKADLVKELIADDPWIQRIIDVQSWESDIHGSKGKGECKGKGIFGFKGGKGKGKGKGVKGKELEVPDLHPACYGPDLECWTSTHGEYPYTGDCSHHILQWNQSNTGSSNAEAYRQPPSEGFFGRGHKNEEKGGGKKILMARFVRDVTLPPGITVAPGTVLTKTWLVRNDSDKPWPANVSVLCVGGDPMTGDSMTASKLAWCEYRGDTCKPGEEREVSVTLTSPSKSGTFEAFWRLCANFPERGFKKFGMRLRVKVTVEPNQDVNDGQDLLWPSSEVLASGEANTGESTEAEHMTSVQEQEVLSGESDSAEFQLVGYN